MATNSTLALALTLTLTLALTVLQVHVLATNITLTYHVGWNSAWQVRRASERGQAGSERGAWREWSEAQGAGLGAGGWAQRMG